MINKLAKKFYLTRGCGEVLHGTYFEDLFVACDLAKSLQGDVQVMLGPGYTVTVAQADFLRKLDWEYDWVEGIHYGPQRVKGFLKALEQVNPEYCKLIQESDLNPDEDQFILKATFKCLAWVRRDT